jgi:hypothetical protein
LHQAAQLGSPVSELDAATDAMLAEIGFAAIGSEMISDTITAEVVERIDAGSRLPPDSLEKAE